MITIHCKCGGKLAISPKAFGLPARCTACGSVVRPVAPWGPLREDGQEFAARLVIMTGPQRIGEQILLGGPGPIEIGKQPGKAVVLTGELVSRLHAKLIRKGEAWHLEDQGSTNGSGVNGKNVTNIELQHGNRVRIGEYEFLYLAHIDAAAEEDSESTGTASLLFSQVVKPWPPPVSQEESDKEIQGGSTLKMVLLWGGPVVLVLALMVFWFHTMGTAFVYTPGALVKQQPVQTLIKNGRAWRYYDQPITPLADITLDAMVLGKQSYDDAQAGVAKWNLVLGWGAMSDPKLLADVRLAQENRGLQIEFKNTHGVSLETLKSQLTLAMIIPASEQVLRQIEHLDARAVVTLKGKLVSVQLPAGQVLTSNLSRGGPYAGNPDVLWLESVVVHPGAATRP